MSRDDVLRMARDAGFVTGFDSAQDDSPPFVRLPARRSDAFPFLERFADLVAADARAARIASQTENEALKARLAASGVAERRAVREAVLAEREACAAMLDANAAHYTPDGTVGHNISCCATAIRARGAA